MCGFMIIQLGFAFAFDSTFRFAKAEAKTHHVHIAKWASVFISTLRVHATRSHLARDLF